MISRRGFLARLSALPFLAWCAPLVASPAVQSLKFHPDAFALTMAPFTRYDVLYGFATLRPGYVCRFVADEPFRASENYRAYLATDAEIQSRLA